MSGFGPKGQCTLERRSKQGVIKTFIENFMSWTHIFINNSAQKSRMVFLLIVVTVWPALPEKVQESERDGEQAEENVRQRQVGDEHISGGQ